MASAAAITENSGRVVANHLVIPVFLITVLAILLFPMPTIVIDVGIAFNFTLSLIILFASLYMKKPLHFSSFPALLLISTLFRLGMNVAASRQILLSGDSGFAAAGHVIQAFGQFVVGGNYVVGVVIFILINIVNLRVILKGSSRIAEVAARFTLDALPGKQMAIDADLNAGIITEDDAKIRRKELSAEAEFYGAMDGAAKFVSGDASAGLFITGINIIGGFFIGIIQKGMDWKVAAETYTILTIGDGLVSQIPSFLISVASGLIVARAASGDDLGTEVLGQLSLSPKPLFLTSAVCMGFAVLPGLPFLPFLALASLSGFFGLISSRSKEEIEKKTEDNKKLKSALDGPKLGSTEEVVKLLNIDTLELELGFELVPLVEGDGGELIERIRSLRRQFAVEYGFVVPPIHIRDNVRIRSNQYRVMLKGSEIASGELKPNHLLAMDPGTVSSPVNGTPTKEPAFGLDALWISNSEKERAQFSGYTVVDLSTVITTHLTELIKSHAHELLGRQETQTLLDNLKRESPKVVDELIPGLLTTGQVQQVLVSLLREHVSVRDLKTILETLADWAPVVKHVEKLTEAVRRKLARSLTAKYLNQNGVLTLASLSPTLERNLADYLQQSDEGTFLALEPTVAQILITKLNHAAERFIELGQTPLILAPAHLRPALARFMERFVPGYVVLSHNEISPSIKVQSVGVISVEDRG